MSFASLKKNRSRSLSKLVAESTKLTEKKSEGYNDDDRFWRPEVDKGGNGYAIIRFLPEAKGDDLPWVRMFNHGFQGPGGWYIENSLTTLNEKDPVSEYNSLLWNNGTEEGKEQARKQKRRLNYISNVLVIKDPANPDNEGKVFLYRYGKKIWDKINDLMQPQFQDEEPINPFDFWEGANFKMKIRNVDGYRNYDKSDFDSPTELGDDDELESIYDQMHTLSDFMNRKNFKSYEELKVKLDRVLGLTGTVAPQTKAVDEKDVTPFRADKEESYKSTPSTDDVDDDLSFFEEIANNG